MSKKAKIKAAVFGGAILLAVAAFIYDGIYIGATASAAMRNVMFVATAVFFILYYALAGVWGNHALWFAFIFFLVFRGALMILGERKYVFGE